MQNLASRSALPFVLSLAVATAAAAAACGGGSHATGSTHGSASGSGGAGGASASSSSGVTLGFGGSSMGQVQSISFDPPMATVTVTGGAAQMASFTLSARYSGGAVVTVVPDSVQFDRPDLATAQVGPQVVLTASGPYAGTGTLHGIYQGLSATATLTVQVQVTDVDPSVTPAQMSALDAPGLGADPAVTSLLYPYDATVFPQGLTSPLLQWNAPSAADVYRIHYAEANYTFDGYYPITLPATLRVPQQYWDKIVASNPGGPLTATLSRYDGASMTAYTSATETWTIAPASLQGSIYYWSTSGTGGMARIQPGGSFQAINGGVCMGCHAVSADGSTLVAGVEGQVTNDGSNDNRAWVSFDLPGVTVRKASTDFSGILGVSPDGKYTIFGDQTLHLGDTAAGTTITTSGLEGMKQYFLPGSIGLMEPAFSPDGKHVAVIEGTGSWYHNLVDGRLALMDFDEPTTTFSNYTGLATAASFPAGQQALTYPTFSPDSQWLAFTVADHPSGCDSTCDDNETQLAYIALQSVSGAAPTNLDVLSNPTTQNPADQNHTNEPTFNPVARGGYFWVVVTSMRDYGNQVTGTPDNGKKRLWVAAVDQTPTPGKDPSHPAFFLEGQDQTTTNMRGFWSLSACIPTQGGGACMNGFECCSGFCEQGLCVTPQTLACAGAGGTCTQTSDCCNDSVVTCVNGACTPELPK